MEDETLMAGLEEDKKKQLTWTWEEESEIERTDGLGHLPRRMVVY